MIKNFMDLLTADKIYGSDPYINSATKISCIYSPLD